MKIYRNDDHAKDTIILISIMDGENGEIVENYRKDIGDLDPFVIKRLLQNMCNRIVSEYRQDLLRGYASAHELERN